MESHKPECLSRASMEAGDCDCGLRERQLEARARYSETSPPMGDPKCYVCTCGADARAIAGGFIGAAHSPGCAAIGAKLAPRYAFELHFEPGTLNIKIGGDADGKGLFVFPEDVLDYVESGDAYREVPIEKDELLAIRDFLIERFPAAPGLADQPVQGYPQTLHPHMSWSDRDQAMAEIKQTYRPEQIDQMLTEAFQLGMKHPGIYGDVALSKAYVRLRSKIPGAFKTPYAPSAEQVWKITEEALDAMPAAIRQAERLATLDLLAGALQKFAPDLAAQIAERWKNANAESNAALEELLKVLREGPKP